MTLGGASTRILLPNCNFLDREFLEKIKPLLEGEEVFKKVSSTQLNQHSSFDPLNGGVTPEQKGFGKRIIRVDPSLHRIQFVKVQNVC